MVLVWYCSFETLDMGTTCSTAIADRYSIEKNFDSDLRCPYYRAVSIQQGGSDPRTGKPVWSHMQSMA